jgi:predicted AAA+ superfamily ATPase
MSSLLTHNPWWGNPENIETDPNITKFEKSRIKWEPRIRHYIELDTEAIYTLRGPRQVGKTTLIKQMIRELLRRGVNERRIFYYSCDLVNNPLRLVEILQSYLDSTDYITDFYRYIFLDEISAVKDWQRGIKHLHDLGKLKKISILMTGSHSLDIRKASEKLPGRRGMGSNTLDKILLPMKFAEYVETRDKEIDRILETSGIRRFEKRRMIIEKLVKNEIPTELKQISLYLDKLNRYLNDYLLTGGVARAINDYLEYGEITENTYRTYVDVTIGDFLRYNNDEIYLAQIIKAINDTLCSQISWRTLERKTDIGSSNTVKKYIDVLKAGFVTNIFYVINRDKATPNYRSDKKIHYADPFIFHALNSWVNQTPAYRNSQNYIRENKSKLVEAVIGDHLIRYAYRLHPSDNFEPILNVFYWKDKKSEVDFIVKHGKEYFPFEVKYSESFSSDDLNGLYNFTRRDTKTSGIVITKEVLKIEHNVTAIPASLLLLLT